MKNFSLVLGTVLLSSCNRDEAPAPQVERQPAAEQVEQAEPEQQRSAPAPESDERIARAVEVEQLGQCRVSPGLRDSLSDAADRADSNRDGQLSMAEAQDALDFLIGGFFFRVDADGDGKITPKERRAVRSDFAQQYPMVKALLDVFDEQQAIQTLLKAIDAKSPKSVSLSEAKSAAKDAVAAVFATVDTNSDKVISREETEQAIADAAKRMADNTFQRADADDNDKISRSEFDKAIEKPLERVFKTADLDRDGALSRSEAEAMMSWLGDSLQRLSRTASSQVSEATTVKP